MNGELHAALDEIGFSGRFPLKEQGRARLVGIVRAAAEDRNQDLSWDDVSTRVMKWMRIRSARALVLDLPRAPPRRG